MFFLQTWYRKTPLGKQKASVIQAESEAASGGANKKPVKGRKK